ncbi:MAG: hypothetical protein OEY01_16415 [Desulfobulbaceae bacterium]|nr:hypothetical protein [Desulfobulbaceae bacterium]
MADKLWMIVDMDQALLGVGGFILQGKARPQYVYEDKEYAEDELLRLQEKHSEGEFVLFEAVAEARPGLIQRGCLFVEPIE